MKPRRAIFRRYAWIVSGALTGSLLVAGLVEIAFSVRENLQGAQAFHASEARGASRRIVFMFEEIARNFASIASSPWSRGLDLSDRAREYRRVMRMLPAIRDVTVVDASGRETLFLSRAEPDRFASGRSVDTSAAGLGPGGGPETRFGDVIHDRTGAMPLVRLGFPDRAGGGTTLVTVNLQFVSDELARTKRGAGEVAYILDARGALVAHSDVSRTLQAAPATSPLDLEASEWIRNSRGEWVLAVRHPLVDPPWTFVVEAPWRRVLGPVMDAAYRTMGFVLAALVLSALLGRWLANRLARPVIELKEGAEGFGAGDLDRRVHLKTGDELEELAREFNWMAAQIKDHTEGLERKVEEKTEALRVALGIAQEAMRAKAMFLAAASHDLRQPLYAISLLSDALAAEQLSEHGARVLARQREAIAVMRTLFDNLLDLSRFEAGDVRPVLRDICLGDVLQSLANEYEVVCRAKGLSWECTLGEATVRTDPELLRRMVGNLLSNAARYTRKGTVRLAVGTVDGKVVIEVADTGMGIPPEDKQRIFDEFVQLPAPGRERREGVGLGLSIVKRISEVLGAALGMDSEPGRGTRFWIELDALAPEAPRNGVPATPVPVDAL